MEKITVARNAPLNAQKMKSKLQDTNQNLMKKLLCQTILLVVAAFVFTVAMGLILLPFVSIKDSE